VPSRKKGLDFERTNARHVLYLSSVSWDDCLYNIHFAIKCT